MVVSKLLSVCGVSECVQSLPYNCSGSQHLRRCAHHQLCQLRVLPWAAESAHSATPKRHSSFHWSVENCHSAVQSPRHWHWSVRNVKPYFFWATISEQLLELHRGQGMDIYWRDARTCPTEDEYKEMVIRSESGYHCAGICCVSGETFPRNQKTIVAGDVHGVEFSVFQKLEVCLAWP